MRLLSEICCRLVISPKQRNELRTLFIRMHLGRFQTVPFVTSLQELDKIESAQASKATSRPPSDNAVRFLKRIGSMTDVHLFETARVFDRMLVTEDGRLLLNRKELARLTGVTAVSVEEALPGGSW